MTQLFKKTAIFGDLHLGNKNNDRQFNLDCKNYIEWFISIAIDQKVDCIIFLGDFFHNRHSIHIGTLNYGLTCLELLNDIGIPIYMIPGNHDEFYKEKREISSIAIGKNFKN